MAIVWGLWLLPMLLGIKPWEARMRSSTIAWEKGGRREILPGTLLAFSVAKDTNHKNKRPDTAWMAKYADIARDNGHPDIDAVALRIRQSAGRVIAVVRVCSVYHLSRSECAALPPETCANWGVWNDKRMKQWREKKWEKNPNHRVSVFVFDQIVELQAGRGPTITNESVQGVIRNTPCFLKHYVVKLLQKSRTARNAGTQQVCL